MTSLGSNVSGLVPEILKLLLFEIGSQSVPEQFAGKIAGADIKISN